MLKTQDNKIICSKRSYANGCERCLYKAHCIECEFLMADFDEKSRSCKNDKVEISAYEMIKVIFFMTRDILYTVIILINARAFIINTDFILLGLGVY